MSSFLGRSLVLGRNVHASLSLASFSAMSFLRALHAFAARSRDLPICSRLLAPYDMTAFIRIA